MAQIPAPSMRWRMKVTRSSTIPMAANRLSPVFFRDNRKASLRSSTKSRVLVIKAESSTINRVEQLLNLDDKPYTDKIIAEYVWVGGAGIDPRSKSRTISKRVEHPSELPKWNYDGSSTGQAPGYDSEVILYPQAIFNDPFRGGNHILVMCDTYTPTGELLPRQTRDTKLPRSLVIQRWFLKFHGEILPHSKLET